MKTGAIILAAGSSRRFGDDKRRARLANGKMVIEQTIETVKGQFDGVIVTLRNGDREFAEELSELFPDITIFRAPDSALGMGHSLANSINEVNDWDGVFVFLADMPHIQGETIETLLRHSERSEESITIPLFENKRGHPVGFSKVFFADIAQMTGDTGAKPVLQKHADKVREVEVNDPGVLKDIDQPSDL